MQTSKHEPVLVIIMLLIQSMYNRCTVYTHTTTWPVYSIHIIQPTDGVWSTAVQAANKKWSQVSIMLLSRQVRPCTRYSVMWNSRVSLHRLTYLLHTAESATNRYYLVKSETSARCPTQKTHHAAAATIDEKNCLSKFTASICG